MHIRAITSILLLAFMPLLFSCNGFEKVKKSNDVNYKLSMANKYFDQKQYLKAKDLYEMLLPIMKGTKNFEPLYYRYAFTHYYLKDYYSASYHFKNFINYFPTSKDADECNFLYAVSIYKTSPKPSLEQTNTVKAMEAFQSYINTHPDSKHQEEVSKYIDECRGKLEEKELIAAKLYYNISQYKAASVAFKNIMSNFPESVSSDYYQLMVIKSNYYYAKASVVTKQEERFVNVLNSYQELVDNYPKSKHLQEAEKFFTLASNNIKKIRNNEHK